MDDMSETLTQYRSALLDKSDYTLFNHIPSSMLVELALTITRVTFPYVSVERDYVTSMRLIISGLRR